MNQHRRAYQLLTLAIITGFIFLCLADTASATKIPGAAVKKALPLIGLLSSVFQFLIGPATVIGSGLYAKDQAEDTRKMALIVAAIGGMACVYFWFDAGFTFFGIVGYIIFGILGVIGYNRIINDGGDDQSKTDKTKSPPPPSVNKDSEDDGGHGG